MFIKGIEHIIFKIFSKKKTLGPNGFTDKFFHTEDKVLIAISHKLSQKTEKKNENFLIILYETSIILIHKFNKNILMKANYNHFIS